ncbi:MAG: carbon-nitrogen hydrolase family protein [Candidatus Promineifilaceae bacterium]
MSEFRPFKLAAIQAAPVYFDPVASAEKACRLISEAGAMGATIAAFSETWLPGYPFFVWRSDPELPSRRSGADYLAGAVEIPSAITDQLCEAALETNIDVVIGVAELDSNSLGTVYCTLLFISNEGKILGRHRKLKPTHEERTAWGEGDGSSLTVYQRSYGRISGLNCWEHNMVLPGYALMAQGTQIHIASWPGSSTSRHLLLSRAFASQAAAYVIDVGALLAPELVPDAYKNVAYIMPGQSSIIDPWGEVIAGPAEGETILMAEGTMDQIRAAKSMCDVGGHYSRPDVFQLQVIKKPFQRVVDVIEPVEAETDVSIEI